MDISLLQSRQREHDERYHPDIHGGSLYDRMNHYALHGMKYTGRIASCIRDGRSADLVPELHRTIADAFIITLATANALNLSLHDVPVRPANAPLSMALPEDVAQSFLLSYAIHQGKIGKALDARDHLESFPVGEELRKSTKELAKELIEAAYHTRMDLEETVFERWHYIERHRVP